MLWHLSSISHLRIPPPSLLSDLEVLYSSYDVYLDLSMRILCRISVVDLTLALFVLWVQVADDVDVSLALLSSLSAEIGRASCRERVF